MSSSMTAALLAAAVLGAPLAVSAQENTAPTATAVEATQAAPGTPVAKGLDPERRVCKPIVATGSRLGKSKVCKTAREWEAQTASDRQALNRLQSQKGLKTE